MNTPDTTTILAALQSPTFALQLTELIMSNSKKSSSFQAVVNDLNSGESCCKVRAVDPTTSVGRLPDELNVLKSNVRNAVAPAIKRAMEATGNTYTCEVGEVVMPGGTLYVVAVVTRKTEV